MTSFIHGQYHIAGDGTIQVLARPRSGFDAPVDKGSLPVHTAAEAECTAILTEDLAGDTALATVRVIDPFAGPRFPPRPGWC